MLIVTGMVVQVHPVLWMPQISAQEAEGLRTQSPSPMPGKHPLWWASHAYYDLSG